MYRINVYRERGDKERARRRQVGIAAGVGLLVGVELLLIGLLALSGNLLAERNEELRRSITQLNAQVDTSPPPPEVRFARALVQAREERVDWTPLLHAVGRRTPDDVILSRIAMGSKLGDGGTQGIDLEGQNTTEVNSMEALLRFMNALRADSTLAARFPTVSLAGADEERSQTFRIICRKSSARPGGNS